MSENGRALFLRDGCGCRQMFVPRTGEGVVCARSSARDGAKSVNVSRLSRAEAMGRLWTATGTRWHSKPTPAPIIPPAGIRATRPKSPGPPILPALVHCPQPRTRDPLPPAALLHRRPANLSTRPPVPIQWAPLPHLYSDVPPAPPAALPQPPSATSTATNGRSSRTPPCRDRCSPWRERKCPHAELSKVTGRDGNSA